MSRREGCRFLFIKDAMQCLYQKTNILGLILDYGIPKWSKGTDCYCSLSIVDESHLTPGIAINIFADIMEDLPQVASAGDLIMLSHVMIKNYGSETYAQFSKKYSGFALFEGKYSALVTPYQVSSNFHIKEADKRLVTEMQKWFLDFRPPSGLKGCKSLSEIKEHEQADLVCKVLHVSEVGKDQFIVFVWDGSDAPPVNSQTKLEDEGINPLSLQLEALSLPRDIFSKLPCAGTILRVIVNLAHQRLGIHFLKPGKWMRFTNLLCEANQGSWYGVFISSTKLRYVLNEDQVPLQRQRSYYKRVSWKCGRQVFSVCPSHSHITVTEHTNAPFSPLMGILSHSEVTDKFRCSVRVMAMYPWRAEDFVSPSGIYRIRLTLEDPTARIHAFLYAEDGETFFGGYLPLDALRRKRNKLLGVDEGSSDSAVNVGPRDPPWIECCLKSYYLDKTDVWGSRNYRIFYTRMNCNA